ncbi:MAG: enoyl-CoA hydratase/isomerase family protein [Actinobacteria bacterium]|nr:enoyl-CoA hydratase/isomerase family protein [Actinomycetota bacterium]MCG2818417.1 enoyl-CoA hydratase-related protein [Actinomycetes bacterium]MBU4179471.1 enoyl-CoA hydratase/isomerase family protein [Actinomycetota bacterium]MBU4219957.1 enoyl-CoA hydratase/isomerase family protein [Actinomycetota bacterium]MBU4358303.1 enoyl-CoA hydratase/isomerase family protein [Actinomycetota bacterium]
MAEFFSIEVSDGVAEVVMDRPPANAMSISVFEEIGEVARELEGNPEVRAVVFSSALEKYFMSGLDLKDLPVLIGKLMESEKEPVEPMELMRKALFEMSSILNESLLAVQRLPFPTIAAINGHALGGGLEFSLCCDYRFMARGTGTIGLTEVNLGLIPGGGGTQRLPRLIGKGRATELILEGRRLTADEALEIGLVNRVFMMEELKSGSMNFAREVAQKATKSLAMAKRAINEGMETDLESGLLIEREAMAELVGTEDLTEGIQAFIQKRPPKYKGR